MKSEFVFCGSGPSYMRDVFELTRFGQVVELTDEQARDAAVGGSAILPREEFEAIGFTEEERKYGPFGTHTNAPVEWQEKRRAALVACGLFRERLEAEVVNG